MRRPTATRSVCFFCSILYFAFTASCRLRSGRGGMITPDMVALEAVDGAGLLLCCCCASLVTESLLLCGVLASVLPSIPAWLVAVSSRLRSTPSLLTPNSFPLCLSDDTVRSQTFEYANPTAGIQTYTMSNEQQQQQKLPVAVLYSFQGSCWAAAPRLALIEKVSHGCMHRWKVCSVATVYIADLALLAHAQCHGMSRATGRTSAQSRMSTSVSPLSILSNPFAHLTLRPSLS